MKIYKIMTALAMSLSFSGLFAQNTITKETYKVEVQKFPAHYIKPENRSYCIKIDNRIPEILTDSYIVNEIELPGWREEEEENAFLNMALTVQTINIQGIDYKDTKTEKEVEDGIQIDHHFFPTIRYTFNIKCSFKSAVESFEKKSTPEGKSMVKTYAIKQNFPTMAEAEKYIKDMEPFIIKQIAEDGIKYMWGEIQTALTDKFIPSNSFDEISIAYLLDETSPFAESMKEAQQYMPQELSLIKADASVAAAKSGLNVWLQKFMYAAGELSNTDPNERKAKEEMIKNLVTIYYITEDYDNCTIYAQTLRDSFKNKDGDRFLKLIRANKADMEKHHQSSRHFVIQ